MVDMSSQISAALGNSSCSSQISARPKIRLKHRLRGAAHWLLTLWRNLAYLFRASWLARFRMPLWVAAISWIRFVWYAKVLRRARFYDLASAQTAFIAEHTVSHNYKGLQLNAIRAFSGERPDLLLRLLSTIDRLSPDNDRILFVGPRAESELLIARSYGFRKQNIRGLDLISYSPQVDLGDMHRMPYGNNSWNAFVLGWVLAYSENPAAACKEIIRTARPGALVAIGVQYHPLSPEEIGKRLGYIPGAKIRLESTKQILSLFGDHVGPVYVSHDIDDHRRNQPGDILLVFSIKK